jgi:small-conductance mechanosensitive channel
MADKTHSPRPNRRTRARGLNWAYLDLTVLMVVGSVIALIISPQERVGWLILVAGVTLLALSVWALFRDVPPEHK